MQIKGHEWKGVIVEPKEWEQLNSEMKGLIPEWYIRLFHKYPIAESLLELPDLNDLELVEHSLEFVSPEEMREESLECYPGCAILKLGYICVDGGGGDPYFINVHEGEDPPVYQILHDISDEGTEIIADGKIQISDSFSELFERGTIY